MTILEDLNQTLSAAKKIGLTPKFLTIGKKQCRELANLEPGNAFLIPLRMGLNLAFSDEEDILEVG